MNLRDNESIFEPPRGLKGRRARRIWREVAAFLHSKGQFHAGIGALLAVYAACVAEIEANPAEALGADLDRAHQLARALGLGK